MYFTGKTLTKQTIDDIIQGNCNWLESPSGQYEIKVTGQPANWEKFAKNLGNVANIKFIFEGTTMKTIEFPDLREFTNSGKPQITFTPICHWLP